MAAHGQHWRQDNPPVCPEPKVFVGQLPFESTTQEVQNLFSQYGTIRSCQVISGPDGRSKGCAMILYSNWTEAELAVEAENGTNHLGGSKPMVVKFADPPRRGDGPIVGIAPKKLFVGQIPATITEDLLRNMFAPYGNVTEVHLLKKNLGSGCGFVTYDRWSSCEAAIAGLHGKQHLEGAKMPMVVKFADAKVPMMQDNGYAGMPGAKRGYDTSNILGAAAVAGAMAGAAAKKAAYNSMGGTGFPYAMGGYGMGMPGMGGHMPGMAGMGGYGMGMMNMGGMNMGGMGMGMGMQQGMQPGMQPGMRPGMGGMAGAKVPGVGNQAMQASKMGAGVMDDATKQWKLFVGQVPFEASEADLWAVFSTVGTILELVVLRTPQGKSKGCAFVTYESRDMAEKAIRQFDGQVALQDDPKQRLLIVKYAGPGGASSPGASAAALVGAPAGDVGQVPGPARGPPGYAGSSGYDGSGMAGVMGPQGQMGGMIGPQPPQQQASPQDMYAAQMQAAQMQAQQQGMYAQQQQQPQPVQGGPQQPAGMQGMQQMPGMGMGMQQGMSGHMGGMQMGF